MRETWAWPKYRNSLTNTACQHTCQVVHPDGPCLDGCRPKTSCAAASSKPRRWRPLMGLVCGLSESTSRWTTAKRFTTPSNILEESKIKFVLSLFRVAPFSETFASRGASTYIQCKLSDTFITKILKNI